MARANRKPLLKAWPKSWLIQGSRDLFEYLCDKYLISTYIAGVQAKVVAQVATRLFGTHIPDRNVITETLRRSTPDVETEKTIASALGPAVLAGVPVGLSYAEMARHPASAHPEKPPIWQAADSKWLNWWQQLRAADVHVEFLCPDDTLRFHAKKFPKAPVPPLPPRK